MSYEMSVQGQAGKESVRSAPDDEILARAISSGDTNAWDRFFDLYSKWVYRFAYHHLNSNHADAEDLTSDILMTAAGSIAKFDVTRGTLDVWLLGVAKHRLARFCRRRRMELPLIPELAVDRATVAASFESSMTRDAVNRALYCLPERQASVLIAKYVEGYSVEELARIHDTTPKAVESLLSRARQAFRAALSKLLDCSVGGAQNDR